jgi:maltose alpha-D-glucosyltransferase/alpha-amylase
VPQSAPPESSAPGFLNEDETSGEVFAHSRASIEAAALLGRRTAEMHLALSTPTDNERFKAEAFGKEDLERDANQIEAQINDTMQALKVKIATLEGSTSDDVAVLLARRRDLSARARSITAMPFGGQRIRIHGDYHLGQTLRTDASDGDTKGTGDFVFLDFEGEPARPLEERTRKQSPLKDVAGMMRSFSYVAYAGLEKYRNETGEAATSYLDAWAHSWQNCASREFLLAYRKTIAANPDLLPLPHHCQSLLNAYLLEKALYELLYELNNRPGWMTVPLAGILSL